MKSKDKGLDLLHGLRVVSLEQYISAPYCTSMLADAGAEVLKIERTGVGDPRRSYDPLTKIGDSIISGGFASYNRGKKSVELSLEKEEDRSRFLEILATADVFVCNLKPGSLAKLGLDPKMLRSEFPSLIICEITGFGVSGGEADSWPAFDSVIQGMSGLASLIGDAEGAPTLAPMGTTDLLAGIYSTIGILMAMVRRSKTGVGSHIDSAMLDIATAFLERPHTLFEFTGEVPFRGIDTHSPVGMFRAGDGKWVTLVIPTDDMWKRTLTALGRPELVTDPRIDSVLNRAKNMKKVLVPIFEDWAQDKTGDQAVAALNKAGQPAGLVLNIDEIRNLKQLADRDLFVPLQAKGIEDSGLKLPRLPLMFDGETAKPGVVPELGEHNGLI